MNLIDPDLLPDNILKAILQRLGSEDGQLTDYYRDKLAEFTVEDAFRAYLEWHGIIGWSTILITTLDGLRASIHPEE